jgi:GNAT superfamily N-acetyltransferase
MANTRPEDWGELRVVKVTRGDDFWSLFDELNNDESGFVHNRNWLVADILWVHTRARKLGLARALLDKLKINQSDSIGEAVGFWEAMGFRKSDENAYSRDLTRMIRGPRRRSRN